MDGIENRDTGPQLVPHASAHAQAQEAVNHVADGRLVRHVGAEFDDIDGEGEDPSEILLLCRNGGFCRSLGRRVVVPELPLPAYLVEPIAHERKDLVVETGEDPPILGQVNEGREF